MNSVERVKAICKERKIPISKLERDLGYSNAYISQLRKGTFPDDRLKEIAQYLDLSVDYIIFGEENNKDFYLTVETKKVAQEIFENHRVLFDVYRSADKDRLIEYAKKLKELRDLENKED